MLITRPKDQRDDLARLLRRHGAQVRCLPAIKIMPPSSAKALDSALRRIRAYRALIFTSANGVRACFARAKKLGAPSPRTRIYAIGPRTARELKSWGRRARTLPERYEASSLAKAILRMEGPPSRLLLVRAEQAREVLPRMLRRRGFVVDVVSGYRTLPDAPSVRRLLRALRAGEADWITFTSPSTVRAVLEALPAGERRAVLRRTRPASIGPITTRTLRRYGIRPAAQARSYTAEGLAQAILGTVPRLGRKR